MDPKSKSFKELQAKWYGKLKAKGFDDIERPDGQLAAWASRSKPNDRDVGLREAKEEYYRLAGHFAYDYKFETSKDRYLWLKHSEGVSIRNIVILLGKKGIKTNKRAVDEAIRKYRQLMFKGRWGEDIENE